MIEILKNMRKIAIIGLSDDREKASNMVALYLRKEGFEVYGVYPKFDEIDGIKIYRNLSQIPADIDVVVMFRKGEFATTLIQEVIQKGAKALWLQLGIQNSVAQELAAKNGIKFVQNRCIKIENERLKDGQFK